MSTSAATLSGTDATGPPVPAIPPEISQPTRPAATDATDLAVETEGLTKSYGAVKAVTDVNTSIGRGSVVGLLGMSAQSADDRADELLSSFGLQDAARPAPFHILRRHRCA